MGIYDKRRSIPRRELKSTLRKHSGTIPGTGGRKYYQREREKIAKEVFSPKYGNQISKDEYRKAIRGLESTKRSAKTRSERINLDKKIRYLKDVGGRNI